jgi:hypothetical protein
MGTPIVTVNVTQTVAGLPNTLQQKGAFISQGATNTASETVSMLTQLADLTALLKTPLALTSLSWAGGVVTATTAAPHGYADNAVLPFTIAGATPAGFNGTFDCTITGASTFTYALQVDPGAETAPGTFVPAAVAELKAMATTFFAQGLSQAVSVLELGPGSAAQGVAALDAYITANPNIFYSYLVPRSWDAEADFLAMLADFEATTSRTYFFVTTTTETYQNYTDVMKCVFALVEAPKLPATEFSLAAAFCVTLHYRPSTTNRVTKTAFAFLFGVTPYPTVGTSALLTALKNASINYVGTGAEGGITNTILFWGTTKDGHDFTYWYSVDWVQTTVDQAIANAIINGSNNPANPLYYNQDGINRLQAVAAATMASGVSFGLVLNGPVQTGLPGPDLSEGLNAGNFAGETVVNAVPFLVYTADNPNDYQLGRYTGFTIVYTPTGGFTAIVFNVIVTQFVSQ